MLPIPINTLIICSFDNGHRGGLKMLGPGSDTIRRYGLIGVGVALLEEVCHCGCCVYKKEARSMFGGGTVWCGRRGCLWGSMLRHPLPLRDQLQDGIV